MNSVTEIVWKDIQQNEELEAIIEKVIQKCFEVEHINPTSLYICVTLTDPKNIREINKEYRNIDKTTDVISFALEDEKRENFTKIRLLGDIYISIDKAKEQAISYEHSLERELSFLAVHGLLHLLGYDHMTKEDEKIMFTKQKEILYGKRFARIEEK